MAEAIGDVVDAQSSLQSAVSATDTGLDQKVVFAARAFRDGCGRRGAVQTVKRRGERRDGGAELILVH